MCFFGAHAQINPSEILSSSGSTFQNNNYTMDFTIGEVVIESYNQDVVFTQGFHQSEITIISDIQEIDFITKIYPNPTQSFFVIEFNSPKTVQAILSDQNGKVIFKQRVLNQTKKSFDISRLTVGNYFFSILDSDQNKSSYIITKLR